MEPHHIKEVCTDTEVGQFQVRSLSINTWYNLSFGSRDVMPHCSCPDFCHTGLLCKHFFAIFNYFPTWQWDTLPEKYRENPYLSLDKEHVFADFTKYKSNKENDNVLDEEIPEKQPDDKAVVPQQKIKGIESQIRQEAIICREKLKGLTSLTYNIEDESVLKDLNSSLEVLLNKFTTFQTIDEKENSSQTLINQQSSKKQLQSSFINYLPLPVRPKKRRFRNRVGEFASMMQKHYKVQVPVNSMQAKRSNSKSVLKRKKGSKHPSSPKKQRTEEQNHHVQNETKTSNDPYATLREYIISKEKKSPLGNDHEKQESIHAPHATNIPKRCISPSSKMQGVQKQSIEVKEEHFSNSQLSTFSNCPSSKVSNSLLWTISNSETSTVSDCHITKVLVSPSTTVSSGQSSTLSKSQTTLVSNGQSSTVSESLSLMVSKGQSLTVGNSLSSTVSKGQSSTVSKSLSSTVRNGQSSTVSNSQTSKVSNGQSSTASHSSSSTVSKGQFGKSTLGNTIIVDENSADPASWVTIANCYPDDPDYKLNLYLESKTTILQKNHWLFDSEIHAGQMLLKRQFPFIDGLIDPVVKGSLVVPAASEFIQIINTGSHWVCLSTISTTPTSGTVKIFDSLYKNMNSTSIEHACRMLMYPGDKVTFVNEKVQRQVGGSDCGLFSLAFATDLCHGIDPTNQKYHQESLRQHYVDCLENGEMSPFPKTEKRVPCHLSSIKSSVAIYCVCRLPYNREEYVQCSNDKCKEWYHPTCVKIPTWAINSNRNWRCHKCKEYAKVKSLSRS